MDISCVSRIGSQLDWEKGSVARDVSSEGDYPVPDDKGHRSLEGLFHLGLAVIVRLRFGRGRFDMATLQKRLWSGRCEGVDAVDLEGHGLQTWL